MRGPWGPVYGPIDLDVDAGGVTVLVCPAGSGRTALLMTLAGRMRPVSGSLSVFGRTRARDIFSHAALAGIDELDTVAESVTVRDLITEQLRWDAKWYKLIGRAGEDDLLDGLDLGADDYLTKPYSPRELMARSRALLRRHRVRTREEARAPIVVGDLVVAPATHEVAFRGGVVPCTPGEFALLEALASEPGRVLSRDQLLRELHGPHGPSDHVTRRTVDVHVANLRKKLDPGLIRTVYGVGYSLAVPAAP